jgi:hypothetical protein
MPVLKGFWVQPGAVAHTCSLRSLGGRDQRLGGLQLEASLDKILVRSYLNHREDRGPRQSLGKNVRPYLKHI